MNNFQNKNLPYFSLVPHFHTIWVPFVAAVAAQAALVVVVLHDVDSPHDELSLCWCNLALFFVYSALWKIQGVPEWLVTCFVKILKIFNQPIIWIWCIYCNATCVGYFCCRSCFNFLTNSSVAWHNSKSTKMHLFVFLSLV